MLNESRKANKQMYNIILDICFPGVVVAALYRSFLVPLLMNKKLPQTMQSMLTCPLCLGFHVSWMWLALRWLSVSTTLGERVTLLQWLTMPLLGGLFSYVLEHSITVVTNTERLLSTIENQAALWSENLDADTRLVDDADSEDQVVEERRRG